MSKTSQRRQGGEEPSQSKRSLFGGGKGTAADGALKNIRKYRLKPMVVARLLAELSVLVVLAGMPLVLMACGRLAVLPEAGKAIILTLCAVAVLIMPWFGFITYQVNVTEEGLSGFSLFKRQSCQWGQIRGLSRRSTHGLLRYVVELAEGGEFTFPLLLKNCDALVALIREHLPAGAMRPKDPFRLFKCDPIALAVQFAQALACLFFILVIWAFCSTVLRGGANSDAFAVVAFGVICSAALGWRILTVMLMPKSVELMRESIVIKTLFFQKECSWKEVKSVKVPFPLLPEGFVLNTSKGSYLIGVSMDAGDELEEAVKSKLERADGEHS